MFQTNKKESISLSTDRYNSFYIEVYIMKKIMYFTLFFLIVCNSSVFSENYSVFKKDGLYGIINKDRTVLMQPEYDYISISSNTIICYKADTRTTEIYNSSLKLLYSDTWINLTFYSENEILITDPMTANGQLLDVVTEQATVFNKKYGEEHGYRDNVGLVVEKNKIPFCYSIADTKGNILLTDIEDAHAGYTNGMIAVIMKDGKSGFVNKKGKMVFEADFYIFPGDIGPRKQPIIRYYFNNNYALVKNSDQKWVQYNLKGKMKVLPDNIEPVDYGYENGLVPIVNTETKMQGYMNPDFKMIIPCNFTRAKKFVGSYAVVEYQNKEAIIDKKGNLYFSEDILSGEKSSNINVLK